MLRIPSIATRNRCFHRLQADSHFSSRNSSHKSSLLAECQRQSFYIRSGWYLGMEEINTDKAPDNIGPYSQAMSVENRIYVSGQGPIDPTTGNVIDGGIEQQTAKTLKNIELILNSANQSLDDVIKTNVYLTNMSTYDEMNQVYERHMTEPYPARAVVEVNALPLDIGIEIEAVALRK